MNRITLEAVRQIFKQLNLRGKYTVGQLQNLVSQNYTFSSDDLKPYVSTRLTTYPHWKNQIQKVLYYLSQKGIIIHDPANESYIF